VWLLPRKPSIIIISLIIILLLLFYPIWNLPLINKSLWLRLAAFLFIASIICIFGYFIYPNEALRPKFDIKISPSAYPRYQSQLREYSLLINNLNPKSVPVEDLRIEFNFRNVLERTKSMPLIPSGGASTIRGVAIHGKDKQGVESSYEELPGHGPIEKKFVLEIKKVKVNNKIINTNVLTLSCTQWPAKVGYSADIIVNLAPISEATISGPTNQFYEGIYFYYLGGKRTSEKINGFIPPLEKNIAK
jgi:hypothetical protein